MAGNGLKHEAAEDQHGMRLRDREDGGEPEGGEDVICDANHPRGRLPARLDSDVCQIGRADDEQAEAGSQEP